MPHAPLPITMRMQAVQSTQSALAQSSSRKRRVLRDSVRKMRGVFAFRRHQMQWLALVMLGLAACGDADDEEPANRSDAGAELSTEMTRCVAPAGTSAAPHSIQDVLDLVNAMPKPVTLPCLLESLQRPLRVHATRSTISAQPAVGRRSPRVFMFFEGLVLSVVPAGMGSALLEFGEIKTELRTLKAEVEFPVQDTLTRDAPFKRILYQNERTTCAFCHAAEVQDERVDYTRAFISQALRPALQSDRVTVTELSVEAVTCDPGEEPERCAMLKALFAQGTPLDTEFPDSFQIFR